MKRLTLPLLPEQEKLKYQIEFKMFTSEKLPARPAVFFVRVTVVCVILMCVIVIRVTVVCVNLYLH